jgi:hypothetical protein
MCLCASITQTVTRSFCRLLFLTLASGLAAAGDISLPLFFIPNQGLIDARFRYLVQTPGLRAGFAQDSIAFQLPANQIQLRFRGANRDVDITSGRPMNGQANFFNGKTPDQWHTALPTFAEIRYRDLYPGIDLIYSGAGSELKSEFHVAPGADPGRIALLYSHPIALDGNGDLLAGDGSGALREKAPDVYQETENGREKVPARYRLLDAYTAAFELGSYDPGRPLIIDPVISYATYLGGSNAGAVTGTAVDASGNLYIAGWTSAVNFPTVAPLQPANGGDVDAFVAKLNSTGTALIYATYIGGTGDDRAAGIAVDSAGEAYVTGATSSYNFPLVSSLRPTLGGSRTAFVLKLNSAGNALLFSTYLGGTAYDLGNAIALDSSGNAWVAGDTQSANFPLYLPLQSVFGGQTDIFLAKLTPAGALAFSTFWGGSGAEHAGGVTLDASGNIYVAGGTYSTNLPVVSALQPANAGNQDAFIMKINSSATAILYATYLGGSGAVTGEQANGIAADASGNAYVTGVTNSSNFPVTAGTVQTIFGGVQDAFVTKINPNGSALVYSSYLGGSDFDWGNGIGLDPAGNAYIAGYTSSFDFPTTGGLQASFNGLYDAFVTMLNTTGGVLVFSTYYGGTGSDTANAIAVDSSGNMFVGGQTSSIDLPLQTPLESANNGGATGWVARLGVTAAPPQTPAVVSMTPLSGSGATVIFTAEYSDTGGGSALTMAGFLVNSSAGTNFACWVTYSPSANLFSLADDTPSSGSVSTLPGGTSVQNDQCVLNGTASSVAISGDTLTLTISLYFQPGFAGPKTVYLSAADAGAATGFVALGSWTVTVPAPQPSVVSVAPNAGTGAGQTFVFTFADASSANNLATLAVLFSTTSQTLTNACLIVVDRNAGTIALAWDSALGSNSAPIGAGTTLQNSQCLVGANSLSLTGQTLSLTVAIAFEGTFNGVQNIYLEAAETGINTGFSQMGMFTVVASFPTATSVVPNSGSGTGTRFSFTISDPQSSSALVAMAMLFGSSLEVNNSCYLVWDSTRGTISLVYDIAANGATPVVPGTNMTAANAQCILNASDTTVTVGPTSVVITVDLTFESSWAGPKNVYLYAAELQANSGWVAVGTWTVTSGVPEAGSVAPASGAGHFPTFVFTTSDSVSSANIDSAAMLFTVGSPANTANACYVVINRTTEQVSLYNDAGTSFSSKGIGYSTNLQNSQCAVGYTSVNTSGTSVSFTLQVLFDTATFAGPTSVYLETNEALASTGWVSVGTWTAQ